MRRSLPVVDRGATLSGAPAPIGRRAGARGPRAGRPGRGRLPGADSIAPVTAPIMQGCRAVVRRRAAPTASSSSTGSPATPSPCAPWPRPWPPPATPWSCPSCPGHGTAARGHGPDAVGRLVGRRRGPLPGAGRPVRHVAVVGLSMGGALTCWLAERHPTCPASPWSTRWSTPPATSSGRRSRGCSTPVRAIDGIGGGHQEGGRCRGRLRRARRWPPSCRCSTGPTRWRPSWPTSTARCCCCQPGGPRGRVGLRRRHGRAGAAARSSGSGWRTATTWPPWTTTPR